jgi:2-oxo-3-hexenedioate decarboxylase
MTTTRDNPSDKLAALAERLDQAALTRTAVAQSVEPISVDEGYAAQALLVQRRLARGERRIGVKMGMTSKAKMAQVGLKDTIWGRLTDAMLHKDGGQLEARQFIHPRAEPEIAFLMRKPLAGDVSVAEALDAIDGIAAAIDILDSRFKDFRFEAGDAIADNCSSAAIFIGPWHKPGLDFSKLAMTVEINGKVVQSGSSEAILGGPINSLIAAARLMAKYGDGLKPGEVFLSGAATAAEPLKPGMKVSAKVESLGLCSFTVV